VEEVGIYWQRKAVFRGGMSREYNENPSAEIIVVRKKNRRNAPI
jgi:hypothetical protein